MWWMSTSTYAISSTIRLETKESRKLSKAYWEARRYCGRTNFGDDRTFALIEKKHSTLFAKNGKVQMGFFASRSHLLVPLSDCVIQHPENAGIMKIVKDFLEDNSISIYDEQTQGTS